MQLIERFATRRFIGAFMYPPIFSTSLRIAVVTAMLLLALSALQSAHAQTNGKIAYSDVVEHVVEQVGPGSTFSYVRNAIFTYPGNTQLTHPSGPIGKDSDTAPAWSADGKKIAWIRFVREMTGAPGVGQWTVVIADDDGANERTIAVQRYEDGTPVGDFASCTPVHLAWSPDNAEVGIGANCASPPFAREFIQPINSPVSQFRGFGNISLLSTAPGFDWNLDGVLHRCVNFNPPANLNYLFCVLGNNGLLSTAIEIDPSDVSTQGAVIDMPRWKYSAGGPRAAYIYQSQNPSNALQTSRSIYTIEPSRTSQQPVGAFYGRFSGPPEFVACTPTNQPTRFAPRYSYEQIAPSPDGKYIAARRTEVRLDLAPLGDSCVIKQVENGIYVLRRGGIVQNVAALGDNVRDPAWQPSPANLTVVFAYEQAGELRELHGMTVQLLKLDSPDDTSPEDTGKIPSNSAGGQYQFEDVLPGLYHVRAGLTDAENSAFVIHYGYAPGTSGDVVVDADFEVVIDSDAEYVERHFKYAEGEPDLASSSVDGIPLGRSRLDSMAAIYYNLTQFVSWVKSSLTTSLGSSVAVHAFATTDVNNDPVGDNAALYFQGPQKIIIGRKTSTLEERDEDSDECPINCEWHEYAHHLDYINRSGVFDCSYLVGDSVHGGYVNSSTCDSFREGIATFLPTMFTNSPDYAGMVDLEASTKAWNVGFGDGSERYAREDFAVAALLWDLVDDDPDVLFTSAITPGPARLHVPVAYPDNVALPLTTLWQILGTELPSNVRQLQQIFDSSDTAPLADLDDDNVTDVKQSDLLFLMHGFYPTLTDTLPGGHAWHYDIGRARAAGEATNADVGLTNHFAFNLLGLTGPDRAYREHHPSGDGGLLGLSVRDASGTPLAGADVHIDVHYPGSDQRLTRHLQAGDGKLVRLQLPLYFDYLPTDGELPACDPIADSEHYVSVTVTAELNGYASTNTASFDNCEYLAAMVASTPGSAALEYTLDFPEDSTQPVTTAQTYGRGQVDGNNATESWGVELLCSDPEDSGFASGCDRTAYRINGGALQTYTDEEPFMISGNGSYAVEFQSTDAAANQEPAQQILLTISAPPPGISTFTPTSGPAGTSVNISGTNFTGATAVQFNGISASFTVDSATLITATVPGSATTGPISVTGPGGTTSSSANFTVPPLPSINAFAPLFATVGSPVTITGSNFSGVTRVAFNGITAAIASGSTATQVVAYVPVGATNGPITVQTPGGTATSSTDFVVTNGLPPSITSFTPTNGAIGSGVTIKGSNLTGATSVTFNGVVATFRYKGSAIVATVPVSATTGPIRVTTAGGWSTSAGNFVVNLPPVIQSIAPTSGTAGSTVTVTGSNFTGATAVKFGGASATFVVVSAETITATVPRRAKNGPISVTTAGGTASSAVSFTVVK